jgi:hypothetical protein
VTNPEGNKFGFRGFVAIVITDAILCAFSLGVKALLIGSGTDAGQILHSWGIVPIGLVVAFAIYQITRMAKAHAWGCLPTVIFIVSAVLVWLVPIGH